jgi:hypothetical protein
MKRRHFVQGLAALPAVPSLIAQQPARIVGEVPKVEVIAADAAGDMTPVFFSAPQLAALRRLSDLIVPAINGTPGALEAHAPEFLDFLIGDSPADRQQLYRSGLDALNHQASKQFGKGFADLDAPQAGKVLAPLGDPWTYVPPSDPLAAFLRVAKADILTATVNSEEWISVVSKRSRSAGGTGMYWRAIE